MVLLLSLLMVFSGAVFAKKTVPEPGDPAVQLLTAPYHNLSTPVVITDDVELFYEKIWIDADADGFLDGNEMLLNTDLEGNLIPLVVTPDIEDEYTGTYPGQVETPDRIDPIYYQTYLIVDGATVDFVNNDSWDYEGDGGWLIELPDGKPDLTDPILMTDWLELNEPWFPQARAFTTEALDITPVVIEPTTLLDNLVWNTGYVMDYVNAWQADWRRVEVAEEGLEQEIVEIDFIDWGNPLENTDPLVGYRFPVELYLYTKLEEPMTAYSMACVEEPSSDLELYAASGETFESYYATVLTNKFRVEVHGPSGIEEITLEPAIGPSGKMNFASGGGGWIPKVAGPHRIYFYVTDPLISFTGAVINNDEHYIFDIGLKAEDLKDTGSFIVPDAKMTWIDVEVLKPNSNGGRKK